MAKYGRAAIRWTSTEDSNTDRVFLLDVPLHDITPGHTITTFFAESLDRTKTETVTIGTGAYELQGEVRYASNPTGLLDVIKAGSQGKTLTYVPDVADPAVQEPVILISPRSPADVALDAERGFRGEAQITLRFRRTNQAASPTRSYGSDVLFAYHAGDSISAATFSRTTGGTYPGVSSTSDFGFGTVSTAAANKARVGWYSSQSSVGPRTIPALLLEPARTNLVRRSYQFTSAAAASTAEAWFASNLTVTTGQTDPAGTTKGSLLVDADVTNMGETHGFVTIATSSFAALSWFQKAGTTADTGGAKGTRMALRSVGGTTWIGCNTAWSSGVPTPSYTIGVAVGVDRYRGGWYRFGARTSVALSTGLYRVQFTPASTASTGTGNAYLFGVQVEQ
jgi:hypothetical protein